MTGVLKKTAICYREWAPHPALAQRVVCTWLDPARARGQPVLPDACIDLVWDGARLQIAGPDTHAVSVASEQTFVGVRFKPGAAPGFLRVSADELVDGRIDLAAVWGQREADSLTFQLSTQPEQAPAILERALLRRLDRADQTDPLVNALLDRLATREPDTKPHAELGVSERTLRRRCTEALGYGPKTLERILRFRHALRLLGSGQSVAEAAIVAGYADQPHFTNESHRLANQTPAALVATKPLSLSTNGYN
jgi:AraC-like DNA-binding protein